MNEGPQVRALPSNLIPYLFNQRLQVHIDLHRVLRPHSMVMLLEVPQWWATESSPEINICVANSNLLRSHNVMVVEMVVEIHSMVMVLGGSAVVRYQAQP